MLIIFKVFSLNDLLNILTMLPRQKNHIKDEIHTPKIKYDVICDGRVVLSRQKAKYYQEELED